MSFFDNFPQETLVDLLKAYDSYISTAADAGLLTTGWTPVCMQEFYESEYQNVWVPEKGDESFYYMYDNVEAMIIAESGELPVPDEFSFNGMTFANRNGQFFCRFRNETEMRPIRSRIQDIEAGDAFIASAGNGVFYAMEASHQNFDEPDEPWIVHDQGDTPWFEEDIVPAEKAIQSFLKEIQETKASRPSLDAIISSAEGKTAAPVQPFVDTRSPHR